MGEYKATVKLAHGLTINLGNYESARIDVGVEIQGDKDKLPELWVEAENQLKSQMEEQMESLKEAVDERKTILGLDKGPTFN